MKITKKKHLEIAIEDIPKHPNPKIELEQYTTPAIIAADLLWNAKSFGDIENRNILDLGCGTGIFTLGSAILGAKSAIGFDVDEESIAIAKKTANSINNNNSISNSINNSMKIANMANIANMSAVGFYNYDINNLTDFGKKFDTLFTNPPFGSQSRAQKGADRKFMEIAIELSEVSYSFHMAKTRDFVHSYYEDLGGTITDEFFYKFPIEHSYSFHTEESKDIEVIVVRVEKLN
ncbi:MAG: METTL5 family protein [Methanobrevibacter sp.]|jgi:putative methylase|nr:METTL5 family protein [Methanobrevibacter sp.]